MSTHQFKFEGRTHTVFTRKEGSNAPFYIRLKHNNKEQWVNLQTPNKARAEELAKDHLRARREGRLEAIRDVSRVKKKEIPIVTLGQVGEAFDKAPSDSLDLTRKRYLAALRHMVQTVRGNTPAWTEHPVSMLNAKFVFEYRNAIMAKVEASHGSDADMKTAHRSGNSFIRQARAVFSRHMLEFYAIKAKLELPAMEGFLKAPAFRGAVKTNYQKPDDSVVARTLTELEDTRESHRDRYLVCWLAFGFGLRKSEIGCIRPDWFVDIDGHPHLELRAVADPDGVETDTTKNGASCPCIPVANGAWEKLEPIIRGTSAGSYLLSGHRTYRTEGIFREVNEWLRKLGWKTQKGFHEFRAYAGCQVVQRDGLLAGSQWLRHASVTTTQQFYGRYLKIRITATGALNETLKQPSASPTVQPADSSTGSATPLATPQTFRENIPNNLIKARFDRF